MEYDVGTSRVEDDREVVERRGVGRSTGLGSNIQVFKVQYVEYGGELQTDEPQNFVTLSE